MVIALLPNSNIAYSRNSIFIKIVLLAIAILPKEYYKVEKGVEKSMALAKKFNITKQLFSKEKQMQRR